MNEPKRFRKDDAAVLSNRKAEKLLREYGCPSVEAILQMAKSKVDWPEETWAEADAIVQANLTKKKSCFFGNVYRTHSNGRFARAGLAVACAVLLFAGIIAILPEGRAYALEVYHAIIRLFDNRAIIEGENTPDYNDRVYGDSVVDVNTDEPESNFASQEFVTIQGFIDETGYTPYVVRNDAYSITSIEYLHAVHSGDMLMVLYTTNGGGIFQSTQVWNMDDEAAALADEAFQEYVTSKGNTIYYAIDELDGTYVGISILENSRLTIGADETFSVEEFLQMFEG